MMPNHARVVSFLISGAGVKYSKAILNKRKRNITNSIYERTRVSSAAACPWQLQQRRERATMMMSSLTCSHPLSHSQPALTVNTRRLPHTISLSKSLPEASCSEARQTHTFRRTPPSSLSFFLSFFLSSLFLLHSTNSLCRCSAIILASSSSSSLHPRSDSQERPLSSFDTGGGRITIIQSHRTTSAARAPAGQLRTQLCNLFVCARDKPG